MQNTNRSNIGGKWPWAILTSNLNIVQILKAIFLRKRRGLLFVETPKLHTLVARKCKYDIRLVGCAFWEYSWQNASYVITNDWELISDHRAAIGFDVVSNNANSQL